MHVYTHSHVCEQICKHVYTHFCICTLMNTCVHKCMHMYKNATNMLVCVCVILCVFISALSFSCVSETMLLPIDFKNFLKSDVSKECEDALLHRASIELVPSKFWALRDYLLFRIMQANAQRPMAVRNITENSISKAKRCDDGGAVIMISISLLYQKICFHSLSKI